MQTKSEIRRNNSQYFAGLQLQANCMKGVKVPANYWLPSINLFISAGQYATAIKAISKANPEQEFKQSFESWSPRIAKDIIRYEIRPAIHERINVRGLIEANTPLQTFLSNKN